MAKAFGDHLVKGDLQGAYDMTAASYKKRVSLDEFKAAHAKAVEETNTATPTKAETDSGVLPSSEEDGQRMYGFPAGISKATWRAWVFSIVTQEEDGHPKAGYEAKLLVVDEGGALKIGHVEFGRIS